MIADVPEFTEAGMPVRWRDFMLALALALFCYANAWIHIQTTPLGVPPDELAHLTHVYEVAVEGRLIPDYAGSLRLPGRTQGNYLGHPPLYYTTLGLIGRTLDWDPVADYRNYRGLSAAAVALGMLLWILTGRVLGLPAAWLITISAAISVIPMFSYLAGSINNDNMAFLGVAVAFYGLVRLRQRPRGSFYVAGLGVLIVLLSKATAALFVCTFFAFWAIPQLRDPASPLRSKHFVRALCAVGVIVGAYYLYTFAVHGSFFPVVAKIYAKRGPPADPLTMVPFVMKFAELMTRRLSVIMSFASLHPITATLRPLFYLMLVLPVMAWLFSFRSPRKHPQARIANAFMLALLATIAVHVFVVRNGYLDHGLFAGIQPRYYSYAVPGLFIMCFLHGTANRVSRALFACFALAVAIMLGITPWLTARAQLESQSASLSEAPLPETMLVLVSEPFADVARTWQA